MQTIEFASLIGSGAATLGFGLPTMCNGANLAFRKSAYHAVNGYEGNFSISSGDDEFLMRKILKKYSGGIAFLAEAESVVATEPQSTLSSFLQQRIRWAGKWKSNSSKATQALAIYIFMFQLSYLVVGFLMIFRIIPSSTFFLLIGTKWLLEFLFLFQICHFLKVRWHWTSFFLLQFLYPLYVCWVALRAHGKSVTWKGRKSSQRY
jgi:cellulose synthase/poly-beta-1,6-N-acetylglucosamine synthase-like glycosyltransferase